VLNKRTEPRTERRNGSSIVALRPGPKKFNGGKDKQPDFEDEKQFILFLK
jgi:hypothetical protein